MERSSSPEPSSPYLTPQTARTGPDCDRHSRARLQTPGLVRLALGLRLDSQHFLAISASFPLCWVLSLQGQGWSGVWGCRVREGRKTMRGALPHPPSTSPDPALLLGQGRTSPSHQSGGYCAFFLQTVAGVLFSFTLTPSCNHWQKLSFPTTLGPSSHLRPEISETPVIV